MDTTLFDSSMCAFGMMAHPVKSLKMNLEAPKTTPTSKKMGFFSKIMKAMMQREKEIDLVRATLSTPDVSIRNCEVERLEDVIKVTSSKAYGWQIRNKQNNVSLFVTGLDNAYVVWAATAEAKETYKSLPCLLKEDPTVKYGINKAFYYADSIGTDLKGLQDIVAGVSSLSPHEVSRMGVLAAEGNLMIDFYQMPETCMN